MIKPPKALPRIRRRLMPVSIDILTLYLHYWGLNNRPYSSEIMVEQLFTESKFVSSVLPHVQTPEGRAGVLINKTYIYVSLKIFQLSTLRNLWWK